MQGMDLQRLGRYVMSRRRELGYATRQEFADAIDMSVRTVSDVEKATRKVSPGSYAMIESKLGWMPGSCTSVLDGGEPLLTNVLRSELSHIPTGELLNELRRRIQPRGREWEGMDPFGDWPQNRQ